MDFWKSLAVSANSTFGVGKPKVSDDSAGIGDIKRYSPNLTPHRRWDGRDRREKDRKTLMHISTLSPEKVF
jgi:hypothetical protein